MTDATDPSPDNRREHPRTVISFHAAAVKSDGDRLDCHLEDISPGGAKLTFDAPPFPASGTEITLDLGHLGQFPAIVCWQREMSAGVQFMMPPTEIVSLVMTLARESAKS